MHDPTTRKYGSSAPVALLIVLIMVISGCCGNIQCDCLASTVEFQYLKDGITCGNLEQSDLTVAAFDNDWNETPGNLGEMVEITGCLLRVPVDDPGYWVIQSDDLGIRDTVQFISALLVDTSDRCCQCPPRVETATLRIDGTSLTGATFVRAY